MSNRKRMGKFKLYTDRLQTPHGIAYFRDGPVAATVDTAGNLAVGRRATLTRMAAGGLLFGSLGAIVAGAGFKKDRVHDARELYLLIESPNLLSVGEFDPSKGAALRDFAVRINNASLAWKPDATSSTEASHNQPGAPGWWKRRSTAAKVGIVVGVLVIIGAIWGGSAGGSGDNDGAAAVVTTATTTKTSLEKTTTTVAPTTTTVATTLKFGDIATIWDSEITVTTPELSDDGVLLSEDEALYVVLVSIVNKSEKAKRYNKFSAWDAQDTEGFRYNATIFVDKQALSSDDIQPGASVKGYVGFEAPKGTTIASVTYTPEPVMNSKVFATWEQ